MRVLIIGADTPVGLSLADTLAQRGREFVSLPRADCRWKSERQAKKSLRRAACDISVDTRIQSAADGGIQVHDIDIARSTWLARASQVLKLPYLHLSCARVFAGSAGRAYREEDHPDGQSTISDLLCQAESTVRDSCEQHLILRMGPVFAPAGINVITHMLRQLNEGEQLHLSREQQGCPIATEDAAWVISGMLDQISCGLQAWGIYHYCSPDITNCFEFAEVLLAAASQYRDLDAEAVQLVPTEAAITVRNLDCNKIRNTFAIKQQPWRASVADHVKQYYNGTVTEEKRVDESNRHRDASA
ncbi:MAG: sugar nucleotide-binding protein [Gammaproteobacteria bacterium]|nr:sugar nucleotide-binding protein [Gammaproteobacteria bacterium]